MKSYVDQFEWDGGWIVGPGGLHYDSEESLLSGAVFGFCGCGRPQDALYVMRDALHLVRAWLASGIPHEEWKSRCISQLGGQKQRWVYWYLLDDKGLTEHGSGVPGWLTPKGEAVLADLDRLLPDDD